MTSVSLQEKITILLEKSLAHSTMLMACFKAIYCNLKNARLYHLISLAITLVT